MNLVECDFIGNQPRPVYAESGGWVSLEHCRFPDLQHADEVAAGDGQSTVRAGGLLFGEAAAAQAGTPPEAPWLLRRASVEHQSPASPNSTGNNVSASQDPEPRERVGLRQEPNDMTLRHDSGSSDAGTVGEGVHVPTGWEELQTLIGLDAVKTQIEQLMAAAELRQRRQVPTMRRPPRGASAAIRQRFPSNSSQWSSSVCTRMSATSLRARSSAFGVS